ncbi:MAG: phage baseplate assembly protein V, partial [Bacteroidales bacterium]|nr:phage baseplate assembly protein V [Bacteroidales bacterium]
MTTNYTLTIKEARNKQDLDIKTNSNNADYQIKSLSYEKRLYSPCCVNMEVSVLNKKLSLSDIKNDFEGKTVSLSVTSSVIVTKGTSEPKGIIKEKQEVSYEIASDYFVYYFNPVFADSERTVFLTLYSRDKLLTLDKFNKVYLNKQLGKGIIKEMLGTVGNTDGPQKACNVTFDVDTNKEFNAQRLQVLSYSVNDTSTPPKATWHEVIQPYRVQYNEDFYSFISRIACRCGEFLYFEDGKLKLGLDTGGTAVDISDNILSKEYPGFGNSSLQVMDCFRNYLSSTTDRNIWSTSDLPCSDFGAFDEYFDVLDQTNLPDSFTGERYLPDVAELVKDSVLPMVGKLVAGEAYTFTTKLLGFGVDLATLLTSWKKEANYVNDKFKGDFITPKTAIESQQRETNKVSQFADVKQDRYGKLMNKQLAEIRDKEMKAAREVVRVRVITDFATEKKIKLGSKVKLDSKEYRVVSCTGEYFRTKKLVGIVNGGLDYDNVLTDITAFELVPTQSITITGEQSAVPRYIPPYNKCAESVPASPQIAVVTADNDPRYIGRVRVRYTWQNYTEKGSPWVRVLAPLASSSGAVHFQPKKGDEVMLGYIDGNIDRPYVAGSLFNDKDKIHDSLYSAYNDTIRVGSPRLDFRKGTIQNWLDSVISFAGMVDSLPPGN